MNVFNNNIENNIENFKIVDQISSKQTYPPLKTIV